MNKFIVWKIVVLTSHMNLSYHMKRYNFYVFDITVWKNKIVNAI